MYIEKSRTFAAFKPCGLFRVRISHKDFRILTAWGCRYIVIYSKFCGYIRRGLNSTYSRFFIFYTMFKPQSSHHVAKAISWTAGRTDRLFLQSVSGCIKSPDDYEPADDPAVVDVIARECFHCLLKDTACNFLLAYREGQWHVSTSAGTTSDPSFPIAVIHAYGSYYISQNQKERRAALWEWITNYHAHWMSSWG